MYVTDSSSLLLCGYRHRKNVTKRKKTKNLTKNHHHHLSQRRRPCLRPLRRAKCSCVWCGSISQSTNRSIAINNAQTNKTTYTDHCRPRRPTSSSSILRPRHVFFYKKKQTRRANRMRSTGAFVDYGLHTAEATRYRTKTAFTRRNAKNKHDFTYLSRSAIASCAAPCRIPRCACDTHIGETRTKRGGNNENNRNGHPTTGFDSMHL